MPKLREVKTTVVVPLKVATKLRDMVEHANGFASVADFLSTERDRHRNELIKLLTDTDVVNWARRMIGIKG